jgi:hypothetical protein
LIRDDLLDQRVLNRFLELDDSSRRSVSWLHDSCALWVSRAGPSILEVEVIGKLLKKRLKPRGARIECPAAVQVGIQQYGVNMDFTFVILMLHRSPVKLTLVKTSVGCKLVFLQDFFNFMVSWTVLQCPCNHSCGVPFGEPLGIDDSPKPVWIPAQDPHVFSALPLVV